MTTVQEALDSHRNSDIAFQEVCPGSSVLQVTYGDVKQLCAPRGLVKPELMNVYFSLLGSFNDNTHVIKVYPCGIVDLWEKSVGLAQNAINPMTIFTPGTQRRKIQMLFPISTGDEWSLIRVLLAPGEHEMSLAFLDPRSDSISHSLLSYGIIDTVKQIVTWEWRRTVKEPRKVPFKVFRIPQPFSEATNDLGPIAMWNARRLATNGTLPNAYEGVPNLMHNLRYYLAREILSKKVIPLVTTELHTTLVVNPQSPAKFEPVPPATSSIAGRPISDYLSLPIEYAPSGGPI